MTVRLSPLFVLGIIAAIGSSSASAELTYFRTGFESQFNGTSRHTSVPLQTKCVSICIVPRHTSVSATRNVRYTILGGHGVRLVDGPGIVRFFDEEPTGNYTIVSNGQRLAYRHLVDDKKTWRASLNDVLAGKRQEIDPPTGERGT